jgi:hypothetical protein
MSADKRSARLNYKWKFCDVKVQESMESPAFSPLAMALQFHLKVNKVSRGRVLVKLCSDTNSSQEVLIRECKFSLLEIINGHKFRSSVLADTETGNIITISRELIITRSSPDALIIEVEATVICELPPDNIREGTQGLYQEGLFTDATIRCVEGGGEFREFKVHKAILASQSAVFKRMFQADMVEKTSGIIEMTDITPAVLSDLVAYLYTGSAPNISTQARELLMVADKYEIHRLLLMCENELTMGIDADNVMDVLLFAEMHQAAAELKGVCLKYIKTNLEKFLKSEGWQDEKAKHGSDLALVVDILEYLGD